MSLRRAGVTLVLAAVLAVTHARRSSPEQDDILEKISSARCTSRCLTLHMTQLTSAFRHLQSEQVLVWCENHRRCAQCLQPCKELWETRRMLSPKTCEKQTECVTSQEFLASLRASRQGDCPPPQRATGFAAACVESCSLDQHCPSSRKCCSNGCGHTCQAPANLYKGVPLKPRRDMNFVEDSEGHVKVVWVSKFNISVEPVIYILQSRWNIGIHPSEDHASPWTTIAMTLSENMVLSDLRPQRWYQFRVAAINSHGSRGFTTPSKHYISSKDPSPPEPPINIRVHNQTLDRSSHSASRFTDETKGSGPTVSVLIHWEPPREGDLPVHNYRVTWLPTHTSRKHTPSRIIFDNIQHPRKSEQSRRENNGQVTQGASTKERWRSQTEPGGAIYLQSGPLVLLGWEAWNFNEAPEMAQCELWLRGLLPATSYQLSVQTVAFWGQKRLKSPRIQTTFTTISHGGDFSNELPSSSSSSSSLPSSTSQSSSSSPTDLALSSPSLPHTDSRFDHMTPGDLRLEAAAPHYHNNQLQVKVFWKWSNHARQRHPGPYILRWHPHICSANVTSTEQTTIVEETHHTVTGLLFACKYRISVATQSDPASEAVAWVTTPACSSIKIRGGQVVPCHTEVRRPSGRKVALRPERLTADFKQVNGSLLAMFRWRTSQHALDPSSIEGFQFSWTLQSQVAMAAEDQEDTRISQTQTVAPSQRTVVVQGLQGNSVYQVHLQILTTGGRKGAAVSKTFHTPAIAVLQ